MKDFKGELEQRTEHIDAALNACFEKKFEAPDNIVSAMKYSLFAGGKRLRPVLMMEACRCFGGDEAAVVPLACAIEMIHTYSLIHDDLPAMDNDDLRRGKPTNHKVYGENMAILAGDALLNYAMEIAVDGMPFDTLEHARIYGRAFRVLAEAAGVNGMIGGQTGDILSENMEINEEQLFYIHAHKTGALLKAAILCGALVGGADAESLRALERYSEKIGLAFQIVDDMLDVLGDEKTLGKPIGSDEKNHKTTFVTLYGMASSEEKVAELEAGALEDLAQVKGDTAFLKAMVRYICHRNK
ncbi:MAG: polyprenyl synthetase family protein [Eubacterium sp.]|nr:polyprenyl synthetase family protein [Eubacterium sp.]